MYTRLTLILRNLSRSKILVPALLVTLTAVTFASVRWIRSVLATKLPEAPASYSTVQQRPTLEALRITLRPFGFEPSEVTRPAGRFLLAVNDRSGQEDARFVLSRQTGERLKEVRLRDTPRKQSGENW